MLGACPTLLTSKSQSSIRHQVRKLRAKVRALMPTQICLKHQKRNKKIQNLTFNKSKWKSLHSHTNHDWKIGPISSEQWYQQSKRNQFDNVNNRYEFEKLKSEEIEKINEDKMYYLEEEQNLNAYNAFLQEMERKNKKNTYDHDRKSSPITMVQTQQYIVEVEEGEVMKKKRNWVTSKKRSSEMQQKMESQFLKPVKFRNSTPNIAIPKNRFSQMSLKFQNNGYGSLSLCGPKSTEKTQRNALHRNHHLEYVEKQMREKALEQKIRLKIKMEKASANFRENKYKMYSKIKQKCEIEELKQKTALKKKNILGKKGDVVKINEELRMMFIKKRGENAENEKNLIFTQGNVGKHEEFNWIN